jgi:hypothetical protein
MKQIAIVFLCFTATCTRIEFGSTFHPNSDQVIKIQNAWKNGSGKEIQFVVMGDNRDGDEI